MFFKSKCESTKIYIGAILDEELKGQKIDKIRKHISGCKQCEKEFEIIKKLKSITKEAVKTYKAPIYLKSKIINAIEEADKKTSWAEIFPVFALKPVYTIPAVIIFTLLAFAPLYYLSTSVSASPIIVKSVNNHLKNTIVDIFDGQDLLGGTKLEKRFDIPGLSWQGIGSQKIILHYLKERKVAYIAFDRKGHKLSLFIFDFNNLKIPDGRIIKEGEKEIYVDTYKGFNVLFWKEGNVGYSMVSDLAGTEMLYFLKYGEGYINQIQKNIELGTFFK